MFWPHVLPGNGSWSTDQGAPPGEAGDHDVPGAVELHVLGHPQHVLGRRPSAAPPRSRRRPSAALPRSLLSYGKDAADQHLITSPLTNAEAIQVLRATASDIDDPSLRRGRASPGWDLQYGYGRPERVEGHAGGVARQHPAGGLDRLARLVLALRPHHHVDRAGHRSRRGPPFTGYTWKLQFAPGAEPSDAAFVTAGTGAGQRAVRRLARHDQPGAASRRRSGTRRTRCRRPSRSRRTSSTRSPLRLRVTDASGRMGEERRTIAVHHDASLQAGFPQAHRSRRREPAGTRRPPGHGHLAIVFGDADGNVHAIDTVSGAELPGWPVHTDPTVVTKTHAGVDPGFEPIVSNVAVGDLGHDGHPERRRHLDDGHGVRLQRQRQPRAPAGRRPSTSACTTPADPPARRCRSPGCPHRGATASPVLADLDGRAARSRSCRPAGTATSTFGTPTEPICAGWPVKVALRERVAAVRATRG